MQFTIIQWRMDTGRLATATRLAQCTATTATTQHNSIDLPLLIPPKYGYRLRTSISVTAQLAAARPQRQVALRDLLGPKRNTMSRIRTSGSSMSKVSEVAVGDGELASSVAAGGDEATKRGGSWALIAGGFAAADGGTSIRLSSSLSIISKKKQSKFS